MNLTNEMNQFFNNNNKSFGDIPASKIVAWAQKCNKAEDVEKAATSTQLRKFYDAIKSIWETPNKKKLDWQDNLKEEYLAKLIFLKPAFTGAANNKKITPEFKEIMNLSIDKVQNKNDFYKFIKFFEAVIQYSK